MPKFMLTFLALPVSFKPRGHKEPKIKEVSLSDPLARFARVSPSQGGE